MNKGKNKKNSMKERNNETKKEKIERNWKRKRKSI